MAKKNEDKLSYLQMPLPKGRKKGKITKTNWSGLNYRNTKDTGELSKELNISTNFAPYLIPSEKKKCVFDGEDILKKGKTTVSKTRWYSGYSYGNYIDYENDSLQPISVEVISDEEITGFYRVENFLVTVSRYDTLEPTTCTGYSSGNVVYDDFETVRNYRYRLYDKELNLFHTYTVGRSGYDEVDEGHPVSFTGFSDYKNITNITTFKKFLFIPTGHSVNFDKVKILDRDFSYYEDENGSLTDEGEAALEHYIGEMCIDMNTQYYLEYANKIPEGKSIYIDSDSYKFVQDINLSNSSTWIYFYKTSSGKYELRERERYKTKDAQMIEVFPKMTMATVAHQRLFGIDDGRVFASGFNDYSNWKFDTASSFSAENAWMSSAQSSDGGNNVAIINYCGSVFVFKKNSTFEILNTKNPFRINELFNVGAISRKGIQVVGNYLIFVSEDAVNLYNGSTLRDIGYKLNINSIEEVVTGTDDRCFYMFCRINKSDEPRLFVYDTDTGLWSEEEVGMVDDGCIEYIGFAKGDNGFYGLSSDGKIYHLNTDDYNHDWYVETDFFTNNSIDIKHISRVQMLLDMAPESKVAVYILYDDEEFSPDASHKIFEKTNTEGKEIKLPVRVIPKKTANYGFKIRIEGEGFAKIYQMELEITGGGEKLISG